LSVALASFAQAMIGGKVMLYIEEPSLPPARTRIRPRGRAPHRPMQIEPRSPGSLHAYANNPRAHSPAQISKIAASIQEFGFLFPIAVERDGTIIVGEARVAAAQQLGLASIPTVAVEHLSEAQIRAFRIADNKLAEGASWDRERLSVEIEHIRLSGFKIELLGFETGEIDALHIDVDTGPSTSWC
jgi:hypothetical protein